MLHGHDRQGSRGVRGLPPKGAPAARAVAVRRDVLARNNALASHNRAFFQRRGITALHFVGAPGSGKTTLLQALARDLAPRARVAVIAGAAEAARAAEAGGDGAGPPGPRRRCHVDAETIAAALRALDPASGSLLFIENLGDLVFPALFDLGERGKVVVMSVTERQDQPLDHAPLFGAAAALVLTKIDLLPRVGFDVEGCLDNVRRVNPDAHLFRLSARDGTGVAPFVSWVESQAVPPPVRP
jgi:hydrogenase nickel incorporation protein HypB